MDYLSKLSHLMFKTKSFFSKVEHEKDYFSLLLLFVLTSFISNIVWLFISLPSNVGTGSQSFLVQILNIIIGVAFSFALPFIFASLIHCGVLLFKGKQGFFNTFKPVTYTLILATIYYLLYIIVFGFYNVISPLNPQVISNIHNAIQSGNIGVADFAPLQGRLALIFVISLASLIHTLYAAVLGISKFQHLKKWKAFISILLFPLIAVGILFALLISVANKIPAGGIG